MLDNIRTISEFMAALQNRPGLPSFRDYCGCNVRGARRSRYKTSLLIWK